MREGVWTSILTPIAAAVGAGCLMPRLLGVGPVDNTLDTLGMALVLTSAGGGLLTSRLYRRGCRRLAAATEAAAREEHLHTLRWPDNHLSPLVAALNDCIAVAERGVSEAQGQAQRMALELRITAAQREHAHAIIDGIEDAVLVTDGFDEVLLCNAAAARIFGAGERRVAHQPIDALVGDPQIVALVREMRQSRSSARRTVERTLTVGGAARTFRVAVTCLPEELLPPEPDASGAADRTAGVVVVLRDATREVELQQAKNDFVSSVTHELRTPLASIRAYAEMLVDGEASDERARAQFYEIIKDEAERLSTMIDNILNISRIESGLVKIDKRPQSPMLIAEKALEVIIPQARLKNIEVRKEMLPAIYQVVADGDLLYQVVLNLLSNAIKYTPDGGRVTLRTEADEARGVITTRIIDTGAGIPATDLPKLFQKFFRVEKNSRMAKGTGLGLPLVKRVIEQDHDGKVFVESVEGRGSTFSFELPMASRQGGPRTRPATTSEAGDTERA